MPQMKAENQTLDYPMETPGSKVARAIRERTNNLTDEERQRARRIAIALINAGRQKQAPEQVVVGH
jgi:hypothetical protein